MKKIFIKNGLLLTVQFITLLISQCFTTIETKNANSSEDSSNAPGPEFISPVENRTAAVGREANFSCSVSNIGKFKVGWLRASDKMIISLHTRTVIQNERISVKYESMNVSNNADHPVNGTWQLIIRHLKESDRGCYMCQINTSPMISQIGCLEVQVSPDILNEQTSTDISVVEGENATLLCNATGRPPPRIFWKREDGKPIFLRTLQNGVSFYPVTVFNGSKLDLYRIDRKQMGVYLCIASNGVHPAESKRVTLSVNFLPNVLVINQLVGAPLGTDIILKCYVEAHPNTVNYWYRHRKEDILINGTKYGIEEKRDGYKVDMRLTIKEFHTDDVGSYYCTSTNSLGTAEGTSRLYGINSDDGRGLVHESHHVSILAGIAEAARGSGALGILSIKVYSFSMLIIILHFYFKNICN